MLRPRLKGAVLRERRVSPASAHEGRCVNQSPILVMTILFTTFTMYYSQRLSSACVLNGARRVLKGVAKMRAKRRVAAKAA